MSIHPSAIIDPAAKLGDNVSVGPWCVVEGGTGIGDGCTLESHAVVKRGSILGRSNHLCEGVVIGGFPQHARMPKELGHVLIGDSNTFREHSTVHRAMVAGKATTVGSNNLAMVGAHVAHDCVVGDHVVLVNNSMLGGHVHVGDRAYIGGGVGVHQFCRVGRMVMIGGLARVVQDVPPYVMIDGDSNMVVGLNTVGLRRNGFSTTQITEMKMAYRTIYRGRLRWVEVLRQLRSAHPEGPAAEFWKFLEDVKRGIVQERRMPPGATLKIRSADDQEDTEQRQARAAG